jgi:hypothetical protein
MSRTSATLSAVAFLYLASLLGVLWLAMKPVPAVVLLAPLAAHAIAAAARADRARRALGAFSFWAGMALASTIGGYAAAVTIAPPITDDGHPVMPIGQAFVAAVLGPIAGFALAYLFAKKVDDAPRARDLVLHGTLAVLVPVAIWRVVTG